MVNSLDRGPKDNHPLQLIMSRTGSFPLWLAKHYIEQFSNAGDIVFDPFCGKGTTLLAARILCRQAYGADIAPEAVTCSAAKLIALPYDDIRQYVLKLETQDPSSGAVPEEVRLFFHPDTLEELLLIRSAILRDITHTSRETREAATAALACLLGILHGHSEITLSVSSAHAFSMAPGYVARYMKTRGIKPPKRNVKDCLLQKLSACYDHKPLPAVKSRVIRTSALRSASSFRRLRGKVDLIVTSPPYLNAQTYAKDNWLRLWLMGFDYRSIKRDYIETGSLQTYGELMLRVFQQISLLLKPGGRLICLAGDVNHTTTRKGVPTSTKFRTAYFIADICNHDGVGLQVEHIAPQRVPTNKRYLHALCRTTGHTKRDLIERVISAIKS